MVTKVIGEYEKVSLRLNDKFVGIIYNVRIESYHDEDKTKPTSLFLYNKNEQKHFMILGVTEFDIVPNHIKIIGGEELRITN
jgi:hypothetical protein